VPLDKNEGVVKAQISPAVFFFHRVAPEWWRTEALNSHGESAFGSPTRTEIVPPTIDTA